MDKQQDCTQHNKFYYFPLISAGLHVLDPENYDKRP